jgi:hypothetical protein
LERIQVFLLLLLPPPLLLLLLPFAVAMLLLLSCCCCRQLILLGHRLYRYQVKSTFICTHIHYDLGKCCKIIENMQVW